MNASDLQARIDAVTWYHEFDFGNGLKARSNMWDLYHHRPVWEFIEGQLSAVDFRGKSVLDIGCWDGYWSFYAERAGAKSVLATDDQTQNWSKSNGLLLAKELYGSKVEVNQDLSVYELSSLGRTFDVILFLGVYYHLLDPFYAFAQIRHCCHPGTVVLIDGPEGVALEPATALFQFADHTCEWLPTAEVLKQVMEGAYFAVDSVAKMAPPPPAPPPPLPPPPGRLGWRWRLNMCAQALKGSRPDIQDLARRIRPGPVPPHLKPERTQSLRVLVRAVPFEGVNDIHAYRPPFGLHEYDSRFRAPSYAGTDRLSA